ncbi:MAG: hypothetical protein LBJ87_12310 [bacterium]|jgi:hypothetical protein|nr:hypothetical protein [bacterium]
MGTERPGGSGEVTETPADVRALLHTIGKPRCAFCRAESDGGRRFWFWYLNEHYAASSSLARLRASHGFCARHTEELREWASPSHITTVYRYLLPPFARAVSAGEALAPPGAGCPACSGEADSGRYVVSALVRHIDSVAVRRTLDGSASPCVPHLSSFAGELERAPLVQLLCQLESRLERARNEELGDLLKWGDPGVAPATPTGFPAFEVEHRAALPTLDRLAGLLAAPSCPGCIVVHDVGVQYLAWLPAVIRGEHSTQWADAMWLCRTHFWQLAGIDRTAAERLLDHTRRCWVTRIAESLEILRSDPARAGVHGELDRRSRLVRLKYGRERKRRDACTRALATRTCPACEAGQTARSRMVALVAEALRDRPTAERYQAGVGLCYHDLRRTLALHPPPGVAAILRGTMSARLSVLVWELEERSRRDAWQFRYETRGPEQDAWNRALRQFSGGVG